MESFVADSSGSPPLPPEPPDSDLDVLLLVIPPVAPVPPDPPDPPPVLRVCASLHQISPFSTTPHLHREPEVPKPWFLCAPTTFSLKLIYSDACSPLAKHILNLKPWSLVVGLISPCFKLWQGRDLVRCVFTPPLYRISVSPNRKECPRIHITLKIGYSGVSADDTFSTFGLLFPVIYMSLSALDWLSTDFPVVYRSSIRSRFELPITLFRKIPHGQLSSIITLYYAIVEWVRQLVVLMNLELNLFSLSGVIPMTYSGCYIDVTRSSAVCRVIYYFIALRHSCLGSRRLNHLCLKLIVRLTCSLKLSVQSIWSIVVMEAPCFFSSFMNSYPDAQDSPVWQCFPSQYHDLIVLVAECLAFLGMSKLVCKSDCHELNCLLSESWSLDVLWILFAIRSLILCHVFSYGCKLPSGFVLPPVMEVET